MDKTIVVGLDTSAGSAAAMAWALDLVAGTGTRVVPVHAWQYPALCLLPFPAGLPVPPPEAMQDDAEARAGRLIAGTRPPDGGVVGVDVAEPIVREGSAARVLCAEAERSGADLVVVGSRGLSGLKGALAGSVSAGCAHRSPAPVAIVPTDVGAVDDHGVVVVGVDGSEASMAAVAFADAWMPEDSLLLLVHAWNLPVTMGGMVAMNDLDAIEAAAEELLATAAATVEHHKVDTVVRQGDPRTELGQLAETADAVVVGRTGHNVAERFLLGSVATHAVHHVTAPTIVVPAPDRADGA